MTRCACGHVHGLAGPCGTQTLSPFREAWITCRCPGHHEVPPGRFIFDRDMMGMQILRWVPADAAR